MYLIADIGNTRIKLAVYKEDELLSFSATPRRFALLGLQKILFAFPITAAILSNTSEVDPIVIQLLSSLPFFIHLDQNTPSPIINKYLTPHTLGKDRIAAAVGAKKRFSGKSVLFIDMGTCITMNFINSSGVFIGGNISPGINMRLRAMHKYTARLPKAPLQIPDEYFGSDTIKALQNGAIKGTFREIDTFIEETHQKFGAINVILTGGDAHLFENYTKNKIFVAPNLVLEGLNEILKYNVDKN